MTKYPTKPGPYWVALDDGNGKVEVVLVHVRYYEASTSFSDGAFCECVDGSGWSFEVLKFEDGTIVRQSRMAYAASRGAVFGQQAKLTWHGAAKAPRSALNQVPELV